MAVDPVGYARSLAASVAEACDGAMRAAYLHGSAALGGWIPERSDVDILFIAADDPPAEAIAAAGRLLVSAAARCPGRSLETSVVTTSQAIRPTAPWPFVLHAYSGVHCGEVHLGAEVPGDADLLMHYAVCLAAGITLLGPPARELIGPVARPVILAYLADELGWGLAHAPECYAVLNACRALTYLADGAIVSKVAGGLAAIDRGLGPVRVVRDALDQQQARAPERPPGPEATAFVQDVAAALRLAAGELPA